MNKNGQHSYKFLMIFHFCLWYNYKNRPWTFKIWLGTSWRITATVGDITHNSTNANAKTSILTMTAGCKEYYWFLTIHRK